VTVALRRRRGRLPIGAALYVAGQRLRVVHLGHGQLRVVLRGASLRGAARGHVTVRVVERFARGRALRFSRGYSTCRRRSVRR
jgi:hypothetical protein